MRRRRIVAVAMVVLAWCAGTVARSDASVAAQELALRFQPHLLFDSAERWRPVDVDAFLSEPGHRVCSRASAPCAALTSVAQLAPPARYVDLRGTRRDGRDALAPDLATCAKSRPDLLDCDAGGRSAIYAHVRRRGRRIAIDYWWFLRYNRLLVGDRVLVDHHEGDWEGVTVIVDAAGTRVEDVHFAVHAKVLRYPRGVPRFDARSHVRVYLANGTHAAYPRPCRSLCGLAEGDFDGHSPWVNNDAAACAQRCVRLLPESLGAPASWAAWNGLWGGPSSGLLAAKPPRTPAFQRRHVRPFNAQASGRRSF